QFWPGPSPMRRRSAAFVLAISLCFCAATASSDAWGFSLLGEEESFALGEWSGDLAGSYEWEQQRTQGSSGIPSEVTRNRYDEEVQLRNEGFYVIDPRLVEGSAGVNFDF